MTAKNTHHKIHTYFEESVCGSRHHDESHYSVAENLLTPLTSYFYAALCQNEFLRVSYSLLIKNLYFFTLFTPVVSLFLYSATGEVIFGALFLTLPPKKNNW